MDNLYEEAWSAVLWAGTVAKAIDEMGLESLLETRSWTPVQILSPTFYPEN